MPEGDLYGYAQSPTPEHAACMLALGWKTERDIISDFEIGIEGDPVGSHPCHTTRHAGPHRAVRGIEVRRDGASPACPTIAESARR